MPEEQRDEWRRRNIFAQSKVDGLAYFFLYVVIPVAITYISLSTFSNNTVSATYCYVTIFVSALNYIYDAANRWIPKEKTIRNTKLFIVIASSGIIMIYCIYIISSALITNRVVTRYDGILLVYGLTVIIALIDLVACAFSEMASKELIESFCKERK